MVWRPLMRTWLASSMVLFAACARTNGGGPQSSSEPDFAKARQRMVEEQLRPRGIADPRVLEAMRTVPRHLFVPPQAVFDAYDDSPLPIGQGQTISQPYIVALMTELARPGANDKALEVGTGSGYQAAVLSRLVKHVYTIELLEPLAAEAARRLTAYPNVTPRVGDGYAGWPEHAPFDVILVTAAPEEVPPALVAQLAPGGRLVIPVGAVTAIQELRLLEKGPDGRIVDRAITPVRFVPLVKRPA
jgi:protein-L-isoaspartate(D-aspartate) O-methyltransferase